MPGAVALLAVLLEDARDVFGVGDLAVFFRLADPADQAARYRRRRAADGLAGQDLVQGQGQVAARRLRPGHVDAELVVDASLVADLALAVQDEHLGRAPRR